MEQKFKEPAVQQEEESEPLVSTIRLRYYVEYQYAESFQFFALFKKLGGLSEGLGIERCAEVSAIQY